MKNYAYNTRSAVFSRILMETEIKKWVELSREYELVACTNNAETALRLAANAEATLKKLAEAEIEFCDEILADKTLHEGKSEIRKERRLCLDFQEFGSIITADANAYVNGSPAAKIKNVRLGKMINNHNRGNRQNNTRVVEPSRHDFQGKLNKRKRRN